MASQKVTSSIHKKSLTALRAWMTKNKIDAYIIPHSDRFQSEYLSTHDERLAWLTGFTGSSGLAVILQKEAALFTDGRYTIQAAKQVDLKLYDVLDLTHTRPSTWLESYLKPKQSFAIDPWLITKQLAEFWQQFAARTGPNLVLHPQTPIDTLWTHDRPVPSTALAEAHPMKYAGISSSDKIETVLEDLHPNAARLFISEPGLVCWLLNIRGRDVNHVPVVLCHALLDRKGRVTVFADLNKFSAGLKKQLGSKVTIRSLDQLIPVLSSDKTALQIDPSQCPAAISSALETKKIPLIQDTDPCIIWRAVKNKTEIKGAELAHKKDAVAFKKFLNWFNKRDFTRETITEMDIAEKLRGFRAEDPDFIDDSFDTIAGFAGNGAIIHYRATPATNKRLKNGNLLLLDSGAQYKCGTTDITRTLAVGKPTREMQEHYTACYKGLQLLSTTRFPYGTTGAQLDILGRHALWQLGLNYSHGTGHGVGSFMSVHEGPQRFCFRSHAVLEEGMILSIEPGVYHPNKFGIRLENLVVVVSDKRKGDKMPMLGLRTLTDVAFDPKLLIKSKL